VYPNQWNPNGVNQSLLAQQTQIIVAATNKMLAGNPTQTDYNNAAGAYQTTMTHLRQNGWDPYAAQYIGSNPPKPSSSQILQAYQLLQNAGSNISFTAFNQAVQAGYAAGVPASTSQNITNYGQPQLHQGTANAVVTAGINGQAMRRLRRGGQLAAGAFLKRVSEPPPRTPPPLTPPEPHDDFCFYSDWGAAYISVMIIPIELAPGVGQAIAALLVLVWAIGKIFGGCD
jgi:hypothetical protein